MLNNKSFTDLTSHFLPDDFKERDERIHEYI